MKEREGGRERRSSAERNGGGERERAAESEIEERNQSADKI